MEQLERAIPNMEEGHCLTNVPKKAENIGRCRMYLREYIRNSNVKGGSNRLVHLIESLHRLAHDSPRLSSVMQFVT